MKKYNTPKKIATLCLVVSGILLILGVSLAFYSYKATSDGYVSIEAQGLTFRYKEGTNHISLSNAMPVEDWEGMDSNITNYFEFEITSNNPTDLLIPYYITARKTDDSDDIDDAIKVGIMEVETAQHDIYNPYEYFEMFEMLPSYNFALNDLDFEKVYNQGDVINNDTYTMVYVSIEKFSTENECLNSEDYEEEEYYGGNPTCVLTDSGYVVETVYGIYDSEEACQENLNTYMSSNRCILKYHAGETYSYDVYKEKDWHWVDERFTQAECEEFVSNNYEESENMQCALRFRKGDYIGENYVTRANYNDLKDYAHNSIDLSNYTEKVIYNERINPQTNSYKKVYRIYMWLDMDADFTQAKYSNAKFGLTFNVYSEAKTLAQFESELAPGLYDPDYNLLASWDELVNDYGLDVEHTYGGVSYKNGARYYANPGSFGYIMQNTSKFQYANRLVLGDVSRLESSAFDYANLEYISLPEGLNNIGHYAFAYSTIKSIYIPASVISLEHSSFKNAEYLTSVIFEEGSQVRSIYDDTFNGCSSLEEVVLPTNLEEITNYAFKDDTNLKTIILPSSLESIGKKAFFNNTSLKTINIPSSLESIGEKAFTESGITNLTLEDNSQLTSIGNNAFNYTPWYDALSNNGQQDAYLNNVLIPNTDPCYYKENCSWVM